MTNRILEKILQHPDKDEIISKLILGISPKDIYEWLAAKYTNISESKFVITEKSLKAFQANYLDIYNMIKKDLGATKSAITTSTEDELILSVQDNPTYKGMMVELASKEIDIKKMLSNMIMAVENRVAAYFDAAQENPRDLNTRNDRVLIELCDSLGANLERYNKLVLGAPDQIIQHNVTVKHIDEHVQVLQEAIRETLAEMDVETSLHFIEVLTTKLTKLKSPLNKQDSVDVRLAESKIINETINKKLSEGNHG